MMHMMEERDEEVIVNEKRSIQKAFDKLSAGHTTLVVAHRLSTLRNMDRIIVLDKGKVIESGTHNSLLRKKGLYAKLWNMQSGGFLQDE